MKSIINIRNGYYKKDDKTIISGINIDIKQGCINFLVGENGVGKSIIFDIICGVYNLNGGVFNKSISTQDIIYMPQKLYVPYTLTMTELVDYYSLLMTNRSFSKLGKDFHPAVIKLLEKLGNTRASKCSVGEIKLLMASLLLSFHNAELFVLDEPSSGLSVSNRQILKCIVNKKIEQGKTVLMSTHIEDDIEYAANIIKI
ncbi:ATP-binding cassette domain-containing protein [Photorhabdus stackebrandtii]|nr:ATP-binding cassette domain-containing protein [Photorhabdus stackebrandtii]